MGNTSSFEINRADRFIQSVQDGITLYTPKDVERLTVQFENHRRRSYSEIVALLSNDLRANLNNFKYYWDEAQLIFNQDPNKYNKAIKSNNGSDFQAECHIALICYSLGVKGSNFYAKFNEDCRSVCVGKKSFGEIDNLSMFLLFRYVMENIVFDHEPPVLYRACTDPCLVACTSQLQKGMVGFGQFTSSTIVPSKLKDFLGYSGTAFQLNNTNEVKNKIIPMVVHSHFPEEEEYLLSPFQLYSVQDVAMKENITIVTLALY